MLILEFNFKLMTSVLSYVHCRWLLVYYCKVTAVLRIWVAAVCLL